VTKNDGASLRSARPQVSAVIASRADWIMPRDAQAADYSSSASIVSQVSRSRGKRVTKLRTPAHHPQRDPTKAALANFDCDSGRSARSILDHADYIDVELRSASGCDPYLIWRKRKHPGEHFIPQFQSTPTARILTAKAREPDRMAQIFSKSPRALTRRWSSDVGRVHDKQPFGSRSAVMGIGNSARFHGVCWPVPARADLCIARRGERIRRTTVTGTTSAR